MPDTVDDATGMPGAPNALETSCKPACFPEESSSVGGNVFAEDDAVDRRREDRLCRADADLPETTASVTAETIPAETVLAENIPAETVPGFAELIFASDLAFGVSDFAVNASDGEVVTVAFFFRLAGKRRRFFSDPVLPGLLLAELPFIFSIFL